MSVFKTTFSAAALVAVCLGFVASADAQLVITEIHYNPTSGNDFDYEWFEIRNDGAAPLELADAWVDDLNGLYRTTFDPTIIAANNPGGTTVAPGGLAVIYDGDFGTTTHAATHDETSFRDTFNVPASVPVISGRFFPRFNNGGDQFGLWADRASYELDLTEDAGTPGDFNVTSFANSLATVTYDTATPWPGSVHGTSIQWNGTGLQTDPASWYHSVDGVNDASVSDPLLSDAQGFKNSTSDFGSPGTVPSGTPAAGLLITEVMFDPASDEPDWEWVEIHNNTGAAIDFGATPYVLDDGNEGQISTANITSGSVADETTAVLFNGDNNNVTDMQAAWGAGVNFIPVAEWESLNNSANTNGTDRLTDGFNDQVSIWSDFATYTTDFAASNTASALSTIEFAELDVDANPATTADNWPVFPGGGPSIFLTDLSLDQSIGANWDLAGNDFGAGPATGVPLVGAAVAYPGGDVSSPGFFTAFTPPSSLPGDFNDDGTVDAADYTVWRDNDGAADESSLNGNGSGGGGVGPEDYDLWVANYGTSSTTSAAVPEPTSLVMLLGGVAGLFAGRRNG